MKVHYINMIINPTTAWKAVHAVPFNSVVDLHAPINLTEIAYTRVETYARRKGMYIHFNISTVQICHSPLKGIYAFKYSIEELKSVGASQFYNIPSRLTFNKISNNGKNLKIIDDKLIKK